MPLRPITSQTSYIVALAERKQDGADFRRAIGLEPPGAVGFDDLDMGAEPARLPRAAGEIPARGGAIAAGHDLDLVGDRAPGQDAVGRAENLARRIGIEIGRRHGADTALAEAPGGGGVGLGDFLEHLHEDFGRRLGAADALRQQRRGRARSRSGRKPPAASAAASARFRRPRSRSAAPARARARSVRNREACSCVSSPFFGVYWLATAAWWSIRRRGSRWGRTGRTAMNADLRAVNAQDFHDVQLHIWGRRLSASRNDGADSLSYPPSARR